jgi:hypothetical protein
MRKKQSGDANPRFNKNKKTKLIKNKGGIK